MTSASILLLLAFASILLPILLQDHHHTTQSSSVPFSSNPPALNPSQPPSSLCPSASFSSNLPPLNPSQPPLTLCSSTQPSAQFPSVPLSSNNPPALNPSQPPSSLCSSASFSSNLPPLNPSQLPSTLSSSTQPSAQFPSVPFSSNPPPLTPPQPPSTLCSLAQAPSSLCSSFPSSYNRFMVLRDLRRRRYIPYIPIFGRKLRFSFLEFHFYNILYCLYSLLYDLDTTSPTSRRRLRFFHSDRPKYLKAIRSLILIRRLQRNRYKPYISIFGWKIRCSFLTVFFYKILHFLVIERLRNDTYSPDITIFGKKLRTTVIDHHFYNTLYRLLRLLYDFDTILRILDERTSVSPKEPPPIFSSQFKRIRLSQRHRRRIRHFPPKPPPTSTLPQFSLLSHDRKQVIRLL